MASYFSLKLWSRIFLLSVALSSADVAYAAEVRGINLKELIELPSLTIVELITRQNFKERATERSLSVKKPKSVERVTLSQRLDEIMNTDLPIDQLLGRRDESLVVAKKLPSKTKLEDQIQQSRAVRVVVPDGPIDEDSIQASFVPFGYPQQVASPHQEAVLNSVSVNFQAASNPQQLTQHIKVQLVENATTSSQEHAQNQILIEGGPNALSLTPKTLTLPRVGATASVKMDVEPSFSFQIFIRDYKILRWDAQTAMITALSGGKTEMYVVSSGKMYILPVLVEDSSLSSKDIQLPEALASLDGVISGQVATQAVYSNLNQAINESSKSSQDFGPSLRDSRAETARTLAEAERDLRRYTVTSEAPSYGSLTLQVIDERSHPQHGIIYPGIGINVHVLGTEFTAQTDQSGHLTIREVPLGSRFWVEISDPSGQLAPGITELDSGMGAQGVIRIRAMRAFTLDTIGSIVGNHTEANRATLCGTIIDRSERRPVSGVSVSIDASAHGPYYFNQLGLIDPTQRSTGTNGRYCFLNVSPGPISIAVYAAETILASAPAGLFAGRHREVDFDLSVEDSLATRLAMLPTAHEQLSADPKVSHALKSIDMLDLIPLGGDSPMMQIESGMVALPEPIVALGHRIWTFARASEFEPVVYSYRADSRDHVTPLLPRGFIDDMAIYAQAVHDPSLGSVLAEYSARDRLDNASITFRLVDAYGQTVGEPWYYSDFPAMRAIFFNVPAGAYSLLVETADGYWLGADTLLVYSETNSYIRIGSGIKYRP